MLRGEFIRGDGLIQSNNISNAGAQMMLSAAFRAESLTLYAGLVTGVPTPSMNSANFEEPANGIGGYHRILISRSQMGWPTLGLFGVNRFIESTWLEFIPSGNPFNKPIQRVALFLQEIPEPNEIVFSVSVPLDEPVTLTPTTPQERRRWKYRIYA